jgi:hypothetical protein
VKVGDARGFPYRPGIECGGRGGNDSEEAMEVEQRTSIGIGPSRSRSAVPMISATVYLPKMPLVLTVRNHQPQDQGSD